MDEKFSLPEGGRGDAIRRMIDRWIMKDDPGLIDAQIVIPRGDVPKPGFETGLMWILSSRYNITHYEKADYQIVRQLESGDETGAPILIDIQADGTEWLRGRRLDIRYSEETIILIIRGRLPTPGQNGKIGSITFNHKSVPGRRNPDGSMNWYELDKFSVVDEGDLLCTIRDPVKGEAGITVFRHPISPGPVHPYPLKTGKGIRSEHFRDADGNPGTRLVADVQGVLAFNKDARGNLRKIEVKDRIKTKSICFKTGNLGDREVKIPVPVFLEAFHPDFKLYSTAFVKCDEVYGGFLKTEAEAELSIVNAGSHVIAGRKITATFVQSSILEAPEVYITRNIIDVRVKADKFVVESIEPSLFVDTEIDTAVAQLDGVLIQGSDNVIDLGRSGIRDRESAGAEARDAADRIAMLENEKNSLLTKVKADLINAIHKAEPGKKQGLIAFAQKMHTYAGTELREELDRFRGYENLKKIESLKNNLLLLGAVKSSIAKEAARKEAAEARMLQIEKHLAGISFMVKGVVAPGATLRLKYGNWEKVYSSERRDALNLHIAGKPGRAGVMDFYKSRCVTIRRSLSYPQVKEKDAHKV